MGQKAKIHLYNTTHSFGFKAFYYIANFTLSFCPSSQSAIFNTADFCPISRCACVTRLETPRLCLICIHIFQKTMADNQNLGSFFFWPSCWGFDSSEFRLGLEQDIIVLNKIKEQLRGFSMVFVKVSWCLLPNQTHFQRLWQQRVFKNFECRLHIIWYKRVLLFCLPMVPSLLKQLKGLSFKWENVLKCPELCSCERLNVTT